MDKNYILAINPGSTSTKIALYDDLDMVFEKNIAHPTEELEKYNGILGQYEYREDLIIKTIEENGIDMNDVKIIVGRGGLLRPIPSGVYKINEKMKSDLIKGAKKTQHASNLGGLIADAIAKQINAIAVIADPPVVDEMDEIAKISGHPLFKRKSLFHALNQKAIGRKFASDIGKDYSSLNLVIAHLGGGISVAAHKNGKVIDVNNALDGDGPFTPERTGSLPVGDVVELSFSGKYTKAEIKKMLVGKGGLNAYFGTNDARKVMQMVIDGDKNAKLIIDAMIYQISKEIGAMCAVLYGNVDAIIITGGIANDEYIVNGIKARVENFANIYVYPGEGELESLAYNGYLILHNKIEAKEY